MDKEEAVGHARIKALFPESTSVQEHSSITPKRSLQNLPPRTYDQCVWVKLQIPGFSTDLRVRNIGMMAGGTGIAPCYQIIKAALANP